MTSRVFRAITAEPWAIEPSWLPIIAALALRNHAAPEVEALQDWQRRDFDLLAGPTAQRLPGSYRTMVDRGVATIPVMGPIFPRANMMTDYSGATSITMLQNDLQLALDNSEVGAIMMLFDSPGGAVSGVGSFAQFLAAATKKKKIVSQVAGSAASAAYWLASQTPEIYIDRTGIVGSIGVVAALGKQVQPNADGEITIEIVSSNAPNKRPDPTTEEGVSEVVGTLDSIEKLFVGDVASGRGVSPDKVRSDFGRGGVKVGAEGVAAGMANKVQSQAATFDMLRRMVANQRRQDALRTAA